MKELIGEFTLRNRRRIYRDGDTFLVEQTDRNGTKHVVEVSLSLAESLYRKLSGQTVTKDQASAVLSRLPEDKPYSYGYKIKFYAQDVLLVLVSLDKADFNKEGRSYVYTIY